MCDKDAEDRNGSCEGFEEHVRELVGLCKSGRILQDAIEQAYCGFAVADCGGTLVYANDGFRKLWGLGEDAPVLGSSVPEYCEEPESARKVLHEVMAKGVWSGQLRAMTSANGQKDLLVAANVLRDVSEPSSPCPLGITAAFVDASHLTAAVQELREANQRKSRFIASIVHELRTPLNGIIGLTELIIQAQGGRMDPECTQNLELILRFARHVLELTGDLLDLSMLETGRRKMFPMVLSLDEIVGDVVEVMEATFDAKHQSLFKEINQEVGSVRVDLRSFRQILLNLVGNASKFTPEGGRITLRACISESNPQEAVVSVSDTGPGIPLRLHDEIFNEFAQAEAERDSRMGGAGIGLAVVKRLVEMQGGQVGVDSQPGQGATFWFTVPRAVSGGAETADGHESGQRDARDTRVPRPRRLLIADDNDVNRLLLRHIVGLDRHEIIEARNGIEAVELAWLHNPELILMDLDMPEMDGLEATRALRAEKRFERVPIFALSASIDDDSIASALSAGCNAYLTKPVDSAKLFAQMRKFL